jgi:hypothetical protein
MPTLPAGVHKEAEIASAVAEVEKLLAPDVVRIRYEITTDWNDDWAVYFRVVLSDKASKKNRLIPVVSKIESELAERLDYDALGLYHYHHYRSKSEQAELRGKAWP